MKSMKILGTGNNELFNFIIVKKEEGFIEWLGELLFDSFGLHLPEVKIIKIQGQEIKLIPLFHPAAIIYNRSLLGEWEKDLEIVKGELNQKTLF